MGSPRRCPELCTAQFLLTIYCAVHILPLGGGQPRKTQSEGGAAAPEEGSNDPDRHHPEVQQGQCRRRSEELRRRLQGRPGDRGRDRRLRQEVLRAVDRHAREARRRQDARQGDRDPDRLRHVGLRGLRRAVDKARRALGEPREGGLQAVRGPRRRRQRQGREVSRKKPSTEAKRPASRPGVLHFGIRSPYARALRMMPACQVVGTRGANDLAKRRRRFYITTQAVGRRVRRAATRLQGETNDTAWCARSRTPDYRRRRASPARRRARPEVTTTAPAPRSSPRRKPGPSVRTFTACSCSTTTTRRWSSSCTCSSASSTGRARTRRASCCTFTRTASASAASTPMRWRKPK